MSAPEIDPGTTWDGEAWVPVDEAPVEGTVGLLDENANAPGCAHPAPDRRLVDGEQWCQACGEVVAGPAQAIVPKDRPGVVDPTRREGDARSGGLRHITWDPATPAASRPYTPDEVELEITDTLDRLERGAGFLTTREEERSAAKLSYELAYARALMQSTARSKEQREAEALLACQEQYERLQLLELTCRTASQGLHSLRSKLSGLQSVLRSASSALSGGGGYR